MQSPTRSLLRIVLLHGPVLELSTKVTADEAEAIKAHMTRGVNWTQRTLTHRGLSAITLTAPFGGPPPQLLAAYLPGENDPRTKLTQAEFLARAWRLANEKARELDWIV